MVRRGSLLEVALGEIVNPRMEARDLDGGSGTGAPDFRVDAAGRRKGAAGIGGKHCVERE